MPDKIIPFGPLNTGQAANTIDDSRSTIANNVSLVDDIGEINSFGPFTKTTYPSAITSAFDYYGVQFVQCGLALYKDGVQIFSLSAADRLIYLPTVNVAGDNYLILMNSGGNYKYITGNIDGVTVIGVDGPTSPPVSSTNINPLGLVFSSSSNFSILHYINNSLDPFIKVVSKARVTPINNYLYQHFFSIATWYDNNGKQSFSTYGEIATGSIDNPGDVPLNIPTNEFTLAPGVDRFKFNFKMSSVVTDILFDWIMDGFPVRTTNKFRLYFLKKSTGPTNYGLYDYPGIDINAAMGYVDTSIAGINTLNGNGDNTWDIALADVIGTVDWTKLYKIEIAISLDEYWEHGTIYNGATNSASYVDAVTTTYTVRDFRFYNSLEFGVIDDVPRFYIYTYEDVDASVESIASPISIGNGIRTIDGKIFVDVIASANPAVDNIRLYRLVNSVYKLVTSVPNATVTIEDNLDDLSLTDIYSGDSHVAPSTPTITGAIELKGRVWGYHDNIVVYSEVNDPESWGLPPNEIQIGDNSPILAIASVRDSVYVFKENVGALYIISTSVGPPFKTTDIKLKFQCISNTVIPVDGGVYYLSEAGVIFFNGFQESNITIDIGDMFKGVSSSMFRVGPKIYCINPQVIIDLELNYITGMNISNLSYVYGNRDVSICTTDGEIYSFDLIGLEYPFDIDYKSKDLQFGKPNKYKHLRELSIDTNIESGGTLSLELYADGKLKKVKTLKDGNNWMRLKVKGRSLAYRLRGSGKIKVFPPATVFHEDAQKQ